jgi:hypothetical protein
MSEINDDLMTTKEFQTLVLKQLGKIDGLTSRVDELGTKIAVLDTVVKMIDLKGMGERLSRIEKSQEAADAKIKVWGSVALSAFTFSSAVVAAFLAHFWK